jgi:hypothetical protein
MEARTRCADIVCDPFKKFRIVEERNAPIPRAVLMPATEAITSVAKQERSWNHEFAPSRAAVLKIPADNDRDRCL